jgi:hypothetical protein
VNFKTCLDERFSDDETPIMILLRPVAPVHLPGAELRDLRLRLGGRVEGPEVAVLLAAFVESIDTIDNIATHFESRPLQ